MACAPDEHDICAGIVTYSPDIDRLSQVLSSICQQVDSLYIYDNGSENISDVVHLVEEYPHVALLIGGSNRGIAFALNRLFERAESEHKKWMLTLDHDTICSAEMVHKLASLRKLRSPGIVCPRVEYSNLHVPERGDIVSDFTEVPACMTSGSLTSIEAWRRVNGFDEWLFIDMVDNDFCMRLALSGYHVYRSNRTTMNHQLGKVVQRRVGPLLLNDFQYSPSRIYYITRNQAWYFFYYRKHVNRPKGVAIQIRQVAQFWMLYRTDPERIAALKKGIAEGKASKKSHQGLISIANEGGSHEC